MSRVTAPLSKLSRSINSVAGSATRPAIDSHHAGAVLMPKYAELLNRRSQEPVDPRTRGITTRQGPTPITLPTNRPLMQTFATSATSNAAHLADTNTVDHTILPNIVELKTAQYPIRVPLLPDNFVTQHTRETPDAPLPRSEIVVVAADPRNVLPVAPLTEVEGIGIDGVELKFAHEGPSQEETAQPEPAMLKNIWQGI